jgi:hypothetical protein
MQWSEPVAVVISITYDVHSLLTYLFRPGRKIGVVSEFPELLNDTNRDRMNLPSSGLTRSGEPLRQTKPHRLCVSERSGLQAPE